ncbi:nuclear pore complex protein NUP214 isoform X2 [Diospyros lotus]|uniref:nuclear pore complex protein NUP214 isoform X2 n=1 Tax=Diospyros lotus TaxID=55363 RepID=UPI002251236E|nr:nuclear pore complex protein NUP214 isoform X2 [Diospyros lotus]
MAAAGHRDAAHGGILTELEGDHLGSDDYCFIRIGEPVPIKPAADDDDDPLFDSEIPPSQPLAVSGGLIFVAHSTGFCVARTRNVIESAKEIKEKGQGSSIKEVSIVDVPLGRVSILALSADDSTLAASIGGDIHFFSVSSLINKEQGASFSCSLNDSSCVKDMRWTKKLENCFVVLSNVGKLYHGARQGPLKHVMDNVDAVEWSMKGNFVAVARKNNLSIFSSKFKQKFSILLSFKSWIGDSDLDCTVKVDSIRWVRSDCIILGCFQLNADGNEENYLVQVITSKDGKITDVSSNPCALSFSDVFGGLVDDIVPFGTGPYMSLCYIDKCQLAITANRKSTDQHIVLFGWSQGEENKEAAVIDILRDTLLPKIDLQGNGDDNIVLGLSLDKFSYDEKVEVKLGSEYKELSPFCILLCLSLDGKLFMFHVASASGASLPSEVTSLLSDEEDDPTVVACPKDILSETSGLAVKGVKQLGLGLLLQDVNKKELNMRDTDIPVKNERPVLVMENDNLQTFKTKGLLKFPVTEQNQDTNAQKSLPSAQQATDLGTTTLKTSHSAVPGLMFRDFSRTESQKLMEGGGGPHSFLGNTLANTSSQSIPTISPKDVDLDIKSSINLGSSSSSSGWSEPSSNGELIFPVASRGGSFRNFPPSTAIFSSGKASHSRAQGPSTGSRITEPLPAIHSSPLSSEQNYTFGKTSKNKINPIKENCRTVSLTRSLNSEPHLSKQLGNSIMDDRLRQIQLLFDDTVQVMAKKFYMEGIVKQASDAQYWDLWNRQSLSSELELKRQRMLKTNQELSNQLIELERHMNTLELNKFGENGGVQMSQKTFTSRYGPSRHIQSLHSLLNTMSTQLATAEQLSECLSKQMAVLSIESPVKKRNVKRELFESIGIPYSGASFRSPDEKSLSRRNQSTALRDFGSDTVRRRRESLDQSWASFEPPRTTVKRILKHEDCEKASIDRSSLLMDKKQVKPQMLEGSIVPYSEYCTTTSTILSPYEKKGIQDRRTKQNSELTPTSLQQFDSPSESLLAFKSPAMKMPLVNSFAVTSSQSSFISSTIISPDNTRGIFNLTAGRSSTGVATVEESDSVLVNESKVAQQANIELHQKPSMPKSLPWQTFPLSEKPNEMSNLNDEDINFVKSIIGCVKQEPSTTGSSFSESGMFQSDTAASKRQPDRTASSFSTPILSTSSLASLPSSLIAPSSLHNPPPPTSSPAISMGRLFTDSKAGTNSSQAFLLSGSSFEVPGKPVSSPISIPSMNLNTESPKSEPEASTAKHDPKTDENPTVEVSSSKPETTNTVKLESSMPTMPTSEPSASLQSGTKLSFSGMASPASNVEVMSKAEQPFATDVLSAVLSTSESVSGGKSEADVVVTQEDEMEEEAPETSQTIELTLESLGDFGIGSAPNPTAAKPNSFGMTFGNAAPTPASSPFTMTVPTGELFRPASFHFQSPQPSQVTSFGVYSGGFSTGTTSQVPAGSVFGQPAQIGAGQQALGSALGAFGQSRQFGFVQPGTTAPSATGLSGGSVSSHSTGGFAVGGFASLASAGGGFSAAASSGVGFSAAAASGVGFPGSGGGGGGGGFGAFSSQQGSGGGGFSAFGSSAGGSGRPPSPMFTQMRK